MQFAFGGLTDTGRVRPRNEDALLLRPDRGLFAVADGMGGHAGGDVASRIAVDVLDDHTAAGLGDDAPDRLEAAVHAAHDAILRAARADPALQDMGTTLTVLALPPDGGRPVIAHVGDSRAYRLRDGELVQLTRDQTWVQEQVDRGRLTPEQARVHPFSAMITCALGIRDIRLDVHILEPDARADDTFLLCSDGLTARLRDDDLQAVLERHAGDDPDAATRALIEAANEAGGPDNITVALVRVDG